MGFVNPIADTVAMGNNQRPIALQMSSGTTKLNPIYDGGPVYDSCGGEPLRGLLSSNTSTPSTPNTPLDEKSRYFFPPPELPPPRTAVYCTVLDPTASSASEGNTRGIEAVMSKGSFGGERIEVKENLGNSEYTVMQPARDFKPSPLLSGCN